MEDSTQYPKEASAMKASPKSEPHIEMANQLSKQLLSEFGPIEIAEVLNKLKNNISNSFEDEARAREADLKACHSRMNEFHNALKS